MNTSPDLIDHFYSNGRIEVNWYDLPDKESIPELPWQQVYAVGNLEGQIPLVVYADGALNLPGGKTEPGESIEDTLFRELEEEINMEVLDWNPIGYQQCIRPDGSEVYQLRVYATLRKLGTFALDPGGAVVGNQLVTIDSLNDSIRYGASGERIVSLVKKYFDE